jgi:3,4-dihydroxy-2-butanone 4-phosphate synthase
LNRCCLCSVMYLCACWIVVACDRSCICVLVESLLPLIAHVFVCLLNRCCAQKYKTVHRQQRFKKHTNTWPITGNNDSTSRKIHDCSQATTIQQAHKYMSDQRQQRFNKHTNTWPITGHNDSTSTQIHARSQATTIKQAHKYMPDHRPQRFH